MACDLDTILAQACTNKFLQLANTDPKLSRAVILQLLCDISAGGGGGGGFSIQSQTVPLDSLSRVYSIAHGLSVVPKYVRIVFLCVAPDANTGYVAGQEISQTAVQSTFSPFPCPSYYDDSTTISAVNTAGFVGNESSWEVNRSDGLGVASPSDFNNFQMKFYYA